MTRQATGWTLRPVSCAALPGWAKDDPAAALCAFARSAHHLAGADRPYRTGALGISVDALAPALEAARRANAHGPVRPADARAFFERHFVAVALEPDDGGGFVTGYYEPQIAAARQPDARFRHPFHRRPDDLVPVDEATRPPGLDPSFAFARRTAAGLREYPDRAAIDAGFLAGRGLEIAYAACPVDVFFAHIQGAARLCFEDGTSTRITYDGKTGHPFTAIGATLVAEGALDPTTVSMATIRDWLARNGERRMAVLHRNRSYIFFRETHVGEAALGPVAAAKVQLTPGRSLAVDRRIHTFATPIFVSAPDLDVGTGAPFGRLMIAQDTGSAIVGPARGDLFIGSGAAAGAVAGAIRHRAQFFVLSPRSAAGPPR